MRWIDDHCHLGWGDDSAPARPSLGTGQNDAGLAAGDGARTEQAAGESAGEDRPGTDPVDRAVIEARAAGVERLITVGTDAERSAEAIVAARWHTGVVWATVGLHPHDAVRGLDGLVELLAEPEVVAVGECGLDYHYDHSPRPMQREMFAAQVALAHERDLALVIHTREAWADTFDILAAEGVPERTVFHCFTGGPDEARRALDLGAHLSFSGIVTFPRADDVRAAVALSPLERVLVETDSPYLAPVPHRGRPNRPAFVPLVGAAVAEAAGVDTETVAATTWATAERVYRLDLT
jgi:TatD DNase family protein